MSDDGLAREELLGIAEVLADMIDGEWGGPLSYSVKTWGPATTPEQMDALKKLEAHLAAKAQDSR